MSIEAMKLALEALEDVQEAYGNHSEWFKQRVDALRAAIEQAERQEVEPDRDCVENDGCPTEKAVLQRFWREHQRAEKQEPVAWHHPDCKGECIACLIEREVQNAYGNQGVDYLRRHVTAPPQREWQGLTDKEHEQIAIDCGCASADWVFYGAAVERKVKEKNT